MEYLCYMEIHNTCDGTQAIMSPNTSGRPQGHESSIANMSLSIV